jgi:DnaK suppressor protein
VKKSEQEQFVPVLSELRNRLLLAARQAVMGDVHLNPDDFADEIDTAASESGLAFIGRLRERERDLLQKTEAALQRIQSGTFGTCLSCGEPIGMARLRARPVATLCIDCKNEQEKLEH